MPDSLFHRRAWFHNLNWIYLDLLCSCVLSEQTSQIGLHQFWQLDDLENLVISYDDIEQTRLVAASRNRHKQALLVNTTTGSKIYTELAHTSLSAATTKVQAIMTLSLTWTLHQSACFHSDPLHPLSTLTLESSCKYIKSCHSSA